MEGNRCFDAYMGESEATMGMLISNYVVRVRYILTTVWGRVCPE
jgi:hypothetical protein